jgi:hypothetical protein
MWYSNLEKTFISWHILHKHWYTCPIALQVRRNAQHKKSFDCCLIHFRASVSTSSSSAKRFPPSCESLYPTNTSHRKHESFLYEYSLHWFLLPTKKKRTTKHCSSVVHPSRTVAILTTETSLWTCACASARLWWSWTVLLPSETHRNPITSITFVLLPFVTYLLTLPRISFVATG